MARRALVHVGMHKTGSTSIQRTFAGYADEDWRYLDLGDPNHSFLLADGFRDKPPARFAKGKDPAEARTEARRSVEDQLAADRRSVVISGEDLGFFTEENVADLVGTLGRHVDEVRVLAYVREPVSYVASSFQEILKRKLPPDDHADRFPPYRKRFAAWRKAVGKANAEFVLFDRAQFKDGDLLVDFAHRVGLSEAFARDNAKSANPAMSAEHVALLFAVRRRLADEGTTIRARAFRELGARLRGFGDGVFAFSAASLKPAFEANARHVAWMEKILGAPFAVPEQSGRTCFSSSDEIVAYAATLGPLLAKRRHKFGIEKGKAVRSDPVGSLVDWLKAQGAAPANAEAE